MKRIIPLFLSAALCLCACGKSTPPVVEEPMTGEETTTAEIEYDLTAEETPAYDVEAYAAAAQSIREEYIEVTQQGIENFDEDAHPEIPWYTAILTRYPDNSFYEGYYDFDDNGVPEMLIAMGNADYMTPIAIYAFDGQGMRYLCKDYPVGERSHLNYVDDVFVVNGSGGASSGILAIYRIAENGWGTEIIDVVHYEYTDAEHVTYTSEYGNISAEEIEERGLNTYEGIDLEIGWNCFYSF